MVANSADHQSDIPSEMWGCPVMLVIHL